jgi:hypothetical protein
MHIEMMTVGTATNTPAANMATVFEKTSFVENILKKAKGTQPIKDELLIKKPSVIAKVIHAKFLSNMMKYYCLLCALWYLRLL